MGEHEHQNEDGVPTIYMVHKEELPNVQYLEVKDNRKMLPVERLAEEDNRASVVWYYNTLRLMNHVLPRRVRPKPMETL